MLNETNIEANQEHWPPRNRSAWHLGDIDNNYVMLIWHSPPNPELS